MDETVLRSCFPDLFAPARWGSVEAVFELRAGLPPASLLAHVNMVPFVGNESVVLRLTDGRPELPDGTLEPGEEWLDTIRRELREEAGAVLRSFTPLGAWRCRSTSPEPYRLHLPHPIFYRVVGFGDIEVVGRPTNPQHAEQVAFVAVLPVAEAAALFAQWQRYDLAALYSLAEMRRRQGGGP